MDLLPYFFKTYIIGFTIAAIFGPISMLFIRKTIEFGHLGAAAVGLGSSFATGTYGLISVAGITSLSDFMIDNTMYIKILGGAFLIYLAYKEIRHKIDLTQNLKKTNKKFGKLAIEIFLLAMASPLTIILFISLLANLSNSSGSIMVSAAMVLGIFCGSASWWIILGSILLKVKDRLSYAWIDRIRYMSSLILAAFGVFSIFNGFSNFI